MSGGQESSVTDEVLKQRTRAPDTYSLIDSANCRRVFLVTSPPTDDTEWIDVDW